MPDSRSRRFATWAFSFEPLGRNLRIAAATHISAFFVHDDPKSRKNAHSETAPSGQAEIETPRIQRTSSSRRAETEKERHLLRELVPQRGVLPQDYPRNHGKRSLRPDEVFVTGAIRSKASSRRRHLLQEPREAKPSARGPATRESPQPGRPTDRETRSPEALFPRKSRIPKATLRAPAMRQSSGRTPARR